MKWNRLCELGRELPEVVEDIWYRTPALKVRGKGFVRLKEDGASVVFPVENLDAKELLLATQPAVYFTTDHYNGYAMVLARLAALREPEARLRIASAYRLAAPPPRKAAATKRAGVKPAAAKPAAAKPAAAKRAAAKRAAAKPAAATKPAAAKPRRPAAKKPRARR